MLSLLPSLKRGRAHPLHFFRQESSRRYLITTGFVAAALVAYYFGLESGSGMLFLAGTIFEIVSF